MPGCRRKSGRRGAKQAPRRPPLTLPSPGPRFNRRERARRKDGRPRGAWGGYGIVALAGFEDYIEIAARYEPGTGKHFAHVAWPDTRNIPPSFLGDPAFDPFGEAGGSNLNIYADVIVLTPAP